MTLRFISFFVFVGLLAQAQPEMLDTAVVSASRHHTGLLGANRNVVVLQAEDIANAPVESVAELLDFATGIDARQRGMFGTQTDLSIRGGTFEQVLVLINGIRISDPQTGHHLMNLPVKLSDIERIEILLGGGAYIFGGSSFSGAINIITREVVEDEATLDLKAGSYESYRAGFSQMLKGRKHRTQLSADHTRSGGFKENTDFNNTNLFGQTVINDNGNQYNLSGGYTSQNFGAQNFYSNNFPDQFEKTRTLFFNAGMKSGEKWVVDRQVYWRRNWDEFQLFRESEDFYKFNQGFFIAGSDTAPAWYAGHNYHRSDVAGGRLETRFESKAGQSAIAAEYRYEGILSNNLGLPLEAPVNIPGSRGSYTLGQDRQNLSLALEQIKKLGGLNLSAALLINHNSDYGLDYFPALTVGYNITPKQKLYSSFNRSFRLPSYTDLYYRLAGARGSENLLPEQSLNYELGYKVLQSDYYLNISAFRREGTNIIDWIQACDTCDLLASNTTRVNFNGLDLSFRLFDGELLEWAAIDFIELGYSYLFTDPEDFEYESLYVFDYLRHKMVFRVQHRFAKNLRLTHNLSYQNRTGEYRRAENGLLESYDPVFLINTRLSYRWKFIDLYLSAQNLLDRRYYDRGNVELPGLWLWSGLSLRL